MITTEPKSDIKAGIFQFICFLAHIIPLTKNETGIYNTTPEIRIPFISISLNPKLLVIVFSNDRKNIIVIVNNGSNTPKIFFFIVITPNSFSTFYHKLNLENIKDLEINLSLFSGGYIFFKGASSKNRT